jgi:endonuclease-8
MPEGHSVHRIARQFALHFVGKRIAASSPQGRFAAGAADLDGHVMTDAKAVGKQLFLEFDNQLWLRVHLGLYGAWDFAGDFTADAEKASGSDGGIGAASVRDSRGEDSLRSIGAPRVTRLRMSEQETAAPGSDVFPPAPIVCGC